MHNTTPQITRLTVIVIPVPLRFRVCADQLADLPPDGIEAARAQVTAPEEVYALVLIQHDDELVSVILVLFTLGPLTGELLAVTRECRETFELRRWRQRDLAAIV
jgi:hypothetical protein